MSSEYIDTPTRRLFEKRFEFWVPRKFVIDKFTLEVAGVRSSGVPAIDEMHLNEPVPIPLTIAEAAEKSSKGVPLTISDPDKNAILMFNMLMAHTDYVKQVLEEDENASLPSLDATNKLENFMRQVWRIARGRLRDPSELNVMTQKMAAMSMSRRIGSRRARQVASMEDKMTALRHSEFKGTKVEELIIRKKAVRGE